MTKPLKVDHAVCPKCGFRKLLDESGHYERHLIYAEKLPNGEIVNTVCDGSGMKASRMALRMERKQVRVIQAIEKRHAEMEKLKKDLEPEVEKLWSGQSITAEVFIGLLKAHGFWETIPPRRKNTIKIRLKCLQYDGIHINVILFGKGNSNGLMPVAKTLLSRIARSKVCFMK